MSAVLKPRPQVGREHESVWGYTDEIKQKFLDTAGGLTFGDGTTVSPREILNFLSVEGPRRYPHVFSKGRDHGLSEDTSFISGIKRNYFNTSIWDRLNRAADNGVPIVLIQGGQSHEIYYGAGGIPVRPGLLNGWATASKEQISYDEADHRRLQIREIGRQKLGIEACQTAKIEIIQTGMAPVSMVAPYLCLRCSDMSFGVEAHRDGPIKLPLVPVDFPVNKHVDKAWAAEYVAKNLRRLVAAIGEQGKREVTEDDLWASIRLHNRKRQLAREYLDLWWAADVPPTNSRDHLAVFSSGNESNADPVASKQLLEESIAETRTRIQNGVRGFGLKERPARIFVCGSCVSPNLKLVDACGGIVVGKDDGLSEIYHDIPEEGDPYEQTARTILKYPYELPTVERAYWTAEQAKKARADGLIFMYQWGCNTQSGIARMVADIVKEVAGIPTLILERQMAESARGHEQLHGRVEVFIEMLQ